MQSRCSSLFFPGTRFQTGSRLFPGGLDIGRAYITAGENQASVHNFVLSDRNIENGYKLDYVLK